MIVFQSCEKFLDESPKFQYSYDEAVVDYNSAQAIVNGVYSYLQSDWIGPRFYPNLAAKGGFSRTSSTFYKEANSSADYTSRNIWINYYKAINAANIALLSIENLDVSKFPSEDEKNKLMAEVKMLRAWFNTHVFWAFARWWDDDDNEYGLLFKDGLSTLNNEQTARISVGESYVKLLEDIDFAIDHLPSVTSQFHVSKELAKVFKAKILMNRGKDGDYQTALTLVDDVIATAPASFSMETDMGQFPEPFEYQGAMYNVTSFESSRMGALFSKSWDSKENLFVRYLENDDRRSSKSSGYAYYLITNASRSPSNNAALYTEALNILNEESNKYRKEVSLGWTFHPSSSAAYRYPKYVVGKLSRNSRHIDPVQKWAVYFFRYPELLLMQAELRLRTNPSDITNGLAPINLLRQNRGEVTINGITERFLPDVSATTHEEAMDIVFKEIWQELGMENGSEYFAALRFETNGLPWIHMLKPDIAVEEDKRCLAIPDVEMQANAAMTQNPGY